MTASTEQLLKRKICLLLVLLVFLTCVTVVLLFRRHTVSGDQEKMPGNISLQEASDRSFLARSAALRDLTQREGIKEKDISATTIQFTQSSDDGVYIGFSYQKDGQKKCYGYCVQSEGPSMDHFIIERSSEALGQQLMATVTEEATGE